MKLKINQERKYPHKSSPLVLLFILSVFACNQVIKESEGRFSENEKQEKQESAFVLFDSLQRKIDGEASSFSHESEKNVLDYYLALPNRYFHICLFGTGFAEEVPRAQRIALIDHQNIPNGYILAKLPSQYGDSLPLQVALFTFRNQQILAVFKDPGSQWQCTTRDFLELLPSGEWSQVHLDLPITYENERIKKLEDSLQKVNSPKVVDRRIVLPEYGTTLEVREVFSDVLLYKLYWKEGRFVLRF